MSGRRVAQVSTFLAKRDYRGADMHLVRRVTEATALLSAFVCVVLAPLAPPDGPLRSAAGWAVLSVLVAGYALLALRLDRSTELKPDAALAAHYAGLVGVAVVIWLSDGRESPYTALFLIWMALAGASHPPRRMLAMVGVASILVATPLFYDEWSDVFAADTALRVTTWSVLTVMACIWTTRVRMQRADLMQEEEHAKRQARLDPLTGLGNRRAFDERLDRAVEDARARSRPLSVIVADLDDFKKINDAYGHLNGDEVLRAAAAAMRAAVRDQDACYRWGGDEFAVLLPGSERDVAEKVAERISASIVATCTRPGGDPQTLAWGTAELAPEMQPSDLLASADLALMTSKHKRQHGSRFRAEAAGSEPETA